MVLWSCYVRIPLKIVIFLQSPNDKISQILLQKAKLAVQQVDNC
jgi:hypothetical protein